MEQIINTGKWTVEELDRILKETSDIKEAGKRIESISKLFLDISYSGSTLIGDIHSPEVFVINLEQVDCFTFIDYVEAMRRSDSFSGFIENLKRARYHSEGIHPKISVAHPPPTPLPSREGEINLAPSPLAGEGRGEGVLFSSSFVNRNHFFTDWIEYNSGFIEDVTDLVRGHRVIQVMKKLNLKKDGTYFIEGITPVERMIRYIPSSALDNSVIQRLEAGDYAGVYSDKEGLDVSHVGIIVRKEGVIYLRHASSKPNIRKVVDEEFYEYISGRPGLIVLRPKQISAQAVGL